MCSLSIRPLLGYAPLKLRFGLQMAHPHSTAAGLDGNKNIFFVEHNLHPIKLFTSVLRLFLSNFLRKTQDRYVIICHYANTVTCS